MLRVGQPVTFRGLARHAGVSLDFLYSNTALRRAAAIRRALSALDAIPAQRRELDRHEHQLITDARAAGTTWQQIAARLGYKDRQAAQQRHQALARALESPSRTRTRQP
jgi:hypothetical protein